MNNSGELDLGPLTWVKGEIDLALGRAGDALKQYGQQGEAAPVALLKSAQTHLHQAHGALAIVGLDGITLFSEALEQVLAACVSGQLPFTAQTENLCQRALTTVKTYLDELLEGMPDQALRLLPIYRELQVLRGVPAASVLPSDLFFPDLSRRPPRREKEPQALDAEVLLTRIKAARLGFQRGMLKWLKGDDKGIKEMRNSLAVIEFTQTQPATRAFWWSSMAFLDALAEGGLTVDPAVKKLCARMDAQIAKLLEGSTELAERLERDVLYCVATSSVSNDHIECVRAAYRLNDLLPVASSIEGGEEDRTLHLAKLRAMRELLESAKEEWNHYSSVGFAASPAAKTQFQTSTQQLAEHAQTLKQMDLARLAASIHAVAQMQAAREVSGQVAESGWADTLSLEVATSLLLVENALESFDRLGVDFAHQVDVMTSRLTALLRGDMPEALQTMEVPHLDDISRKAQEQLMMDQLVREISNLLGGVEQKLDLYFRDPVGKVNELSGLQVPLKQIEGALSILSETRAVEVLRECAQHIAGFAQPGYEPVQTVFEDVAHKLSALGFFAEKLRHGSVSLDAMLNPRAAVTPVEDAIPAFAPPPLSPSVSTPEPALPLVEEAPTVALDELAAVAPTSSEPWMASLPELPEAERQISVPPVSTPVELSTLFEATAPDAVNVADCRVGDEQDIQGEQEQGEQENQWESPTEPVGTDIDDAVVEIPDLPDLPALAPPPVVPSAEASRLVDASSASIDAELLGIFLEEAREVLQTIREHVPRLDEQAHDHETLTVIRRSFHTLKGSGRMVGLTDLGEAAWSVEQLMNDWLKRNQGATPGLLHVIRAAQTLFIAWVHDLESAQMPPSASSPSVTELHAQCERLMRGEELDTPVVLEEFTPPLDVADGMQPALSPDVPVPAVELPCVDGGDSVVIGELSLSRMVYDIYLDEAMSHMMLLEVELPTLRVSTATPEILRAAHTLGGVSGTLGLKPINRIGKALEYALERFVAAAVLPDEAQYGVLGLSIAHLRRMLESVARRQMPVLDESLLVSLEALMPQEVALEKEIDTIKPIELVGISDTPDVPDIPETIAPFGTMDTMEPIETVEPSSATELPDSSTRVETEETELSQRTSVVEPPVLSETPSRHSVLEGEESFAEQRRKLRIHDDLDPQLLPIFLEEGGDLMREIGAELRSWRANPEDAQIPLHLQRLLHTLKGSARMAGAMRMGETVHGIETHIIQATRRGAVPTAEFLDGLDEFYDRTLTMYEGLARGETTPDEAASIAKDSGEAQTIATIAGDAMSSSQTVREAESVLMAGVDVRPGQAMEATGGDTGGARAHLRVHAELIDQFINDVGEMTIARSRVEGEMRTVKSALLDLTENVIRLRQQLREIEIQAETQMQSQMAQLQEAHQGFDPLEMDRFTRFQELTRMMAESVNDVTTVQHNLLRNVDNATTALAAQARINRDLSQSLMGVRMVPFNSIIDRLYRVVRQSAKELDKRVNLDIRGGQIEIDRSVLEKMVAPIEHLLRNCTAHGIESREVRRAAGKADIGEILIELTQQGNEIVIALSDDGAGLDYDRIRAKAVEQGLLPASHWVNEARLTEFIFEPGFSTASKVSEISGRGVGMDVVKTEATMLGGHVEVQSETGHGTFFRIFLPLTLSVVQAVLVRSGSRIVALPSSMVEQVMELRPEAVEAIRLAAGTDWLGTHYPWCYLPRLLEESTGMPPPARRHWVLLLKGADRRIALEVDGLLGNQEVVVKNIGPQLSHVPGVTGATVLNDGQIALILNPVMLFSRAARLASEGGIPSGADANVGAADVAAAAVVPTIMVVDDSLTVRKIVSRLLAREGYQVVTAKDGVDALEQLLDMVPAAMLVDIEMPRMDGFELTRNVRSQEHLKHVPIIMITSRIADKHRNYAQEIGVNEYLGKPYDEEVLLGRLREFVEQQGMVAPKVP